MSIKITSPIEGLSEPSTFGPLTVTFKDGVAEVDELPTPLRAWLETKGYKVEAIAAEPAGPFDPSAHTVDEVLAHLGLADGSQPPTVEEYDRVVAAERDGKARKSLLEAFDKAAQAASDEGGDGDQGGGSE